MQVTEIPFVKHVGITRKEEGVLVDEGVAMVGEFNGLCKKSNTRKINETRKYSTMGT